ncbi:MAG TPA: pyruvate, water dikinase regulatory protein [Symbiobacteriaceae bacterium]
MGVRPVVFVVSDSVGETAELVARAALAQFGLSTLEIRRFPMVEDRQAVREVVEAACRQPTLIVYTIIVPEVREELKRLAMEHDIVAVDVMGPVLDGLIRLLGQRPQLKPGLVRRMDDEYFRRIEAVEFAVNYDDGKDPRGFLRADVVLIGVSRSSKTPVAMYLAHRRIKVANLPLVPEVPLPAELFQVPPEKVVGLRIAPETLQEIRAERVRTLGLRADASYSSPERIRMELEYAEEVFKKVGCSVVDVTNKAVEEIAVRVLENIRRTGVKSDD